MRRHSLLQPALVLSALAGYAVRAMSTPQCASFPTFMWGGHPSYFDRVNAYEHQSLGHGEVADMIHGFREHSHQPEVAVVFVLPSTFQGDQKPAKAILPSLHKAVSSSASSMVVPCVTRSGPESLEQLLTAAAEGSDVPSSMRPDELLEVVRSSPSVFRDGKLDVIVTTVPPEASLVEINELLEQVSAGLQSSVTNGRYLVFQTSEFSPDHPVGVVRRKLTHRRLAAASAPYYEKHYVYVTPNVLSGLLTIVLFFVIVYIGVGCLASLQTPSKFIHARIPEGKEF